MKLSNRLEERLQKLYKEGKLPWYPYTLIGQKKNKRGVMKIVYVIHEEDLEDGEHSVIGVASSLEKVKPMINGYYGEFKILSTNDIREGNLEYSQVLLVEGYKDLYQVRITIEYFNLNQV